LSLADFISVLKVEAGMVAGNFADRPPRRYKDGFLELHLTRTMTMDDCVLVYLDGEYSYPVAQGRRNHEHMEDLMIFKVTPVLFVPQVEVVAVCMSQDAVISATFSELVNRLRHYTVAKEGKRKRGPASPFSQEDKLQLVKKALQAKEEEGMTYEAFAMKELIHPNTLRKYMDEMEALGLLE
jgi:hypothetical protein